MLNFIGLENKSCSLLFCQNTHVLETPVVLALYDFSSKQKLLERGGQDIFQERQDPDKELGLKKSVGLIQQRSTFFIRTHPSKTLITGQARKRPLHGYGISHTLYSKMVFFFLGITHYGGELGGGKNLFSNIPQLPFGATTDKS